MRYLDPHHATWYAAGAADAALGVPSLLVPAGWRSDAYWSGFRDAMAGARPEDPAIVAARERATEPFPECDTIGSL